MLFCYKTRVFPAAATLLLALATIVSASAQESRTTLVEPPGPLLPAALGDFTKSAPAPVGDGLGQLDPTQAPAFQEDGLKRFERSDYNSGPHHGTLTAYQFIDASGAYAAFSYTRKSDPLAPGKHLGDNAATGPDGFVLQSGPNLLVASFDLPPARINTLLADLIPHLPKAVGPAAPPPLLPTYLPVKNLIPGSARYSLGPTSYTADGGVLPANILGFDKSAEAITAQYQTHSHNHGLLTILLYPTPTIAGEEGRAIEAQLKAGVVGPGTFVLRREGPMLLLANGGFTDPEAHQIVDNIHLNNEVTWNKEKPLEFHAEVKKTASLLTTIVVFCSLAGLAALLLGIFFGGGRAAIRVLRGKPAHTEPEFLRIDLSGPAHTLRNPLGEDPSHSPRI
jgi:hypothetical protein